MNHVIIKNVSAENYIVEELGGVVVVAPGEEFDLMGTKEDPTWYVNNEMALNDAMWVLTGAGLYQALHSDPPKLESRVVEMP